MRRSPFVLLGADVQIPAKLANRARQLKPRTSWRNAMLTSWVAAAGLLTSPATSTRRATAASLRLCATLDEGLEVAVFAMG